MIEKLSYYAGVFFEWLGDMAMKYIFNPLIDVLKDLANK